MKSIAALGLALSLAFALPISERQNDGGVDDTVVLNYALTLEHLENAFYKGALEQFDEAAFESAGLPSFARGRFAQMSEHEQAHVNFLSAALGDNATQPCEYNFPYTDPISFAGLSQILEGVGVSAYVGAAASITNPDFLTAAASVLSTEARHASFVAGAVNNINSWSGAFDVPLTFNEVYSLASTFIVSCPETNPALPVKAFPTLTPTPAVASPGEEITLAFDGSTGDVSDLYAVFLTGLTKVAVPLNEGGVVRIPDDLRGTVYVVVAKGAAAANGTVTDETTVAGVAAFEFAFTPDGSLLK